MHFYGKALYLGLKNLDWNAKCVPLIIKSTCFIDKKYHKQGLKTNDNLEVSICSLCKEFFKTKGRNP